jgi:hypothetical protein
MGRIQEGMKSICDNIIIAYGERRNTLEGLKKDTESLRDNARKFIREIGSDLKEARKTWRTMENTLRSKKKVV